MAPSRRGDISAAAFRAFIAGTVVTRLPINNENVKTTGNSYMMISKLI